MHKRAREIIRMARVAGVDNPRLETTRGSHGKLLGTVNGKPFSIVAVWSAPSQSARHMAAWKVRLRKAVEALQ